MLSNIIAVIMCAVVAAAGVFAWWMEHGGMSGDSEGKAERKDNEIKETERSSKNEKN